MGGGLIICCKDVIEHVFPLQHLKEALGLGLVQNNRVHPPDGMGWESWGKGSRVLWSRQRA